MEREHEGDGRDGDGDVLLQERGDALRDRQLGAAVEGLDADPGDVAVLIQHAYQVVQPVRAPLLSLKLTTGAGATMLGVVVAAATEMDDGVAVPVTAEAELMPKVANARAMTSMPAKRVKNLRMRLCMSTPGVVGVSKCGCTPFLSSRLCLMSVEKQAASLRLYPHQTNTLLSNCNLTVKVPFYLRRERCYRTLAPGYGKMLCTF